MKKLWIILLYHELKPQRMNTPVSFELAKLLKENGYRILPEFESSYPTIAEVIMWLYEKHKLWILPIPTVTGHFAYKILDVQDSPENEIERPPYTGVSAMDFNSPTEAYAAAIEYTLNNLLQRP